MTSRERMRRLRERRRQGRPKDTQEVKLPRWVENYLAWREHCVEAADRVGAKE